MGWAGYSERGPGGKGSWEGAAQPCSCAHALQSPGAGAMKCWSHSLTFRAVGESSRAQRLEETIADHQ
jgi:hypothetical protein